MRSSTDDLSDFAGKSKGFWVKRLYIRKLERVAIFNYDSNWLISVITGFEMKKSDLNLWSNVANSEYVRCTIASATTFEDCST